MTIVSLFRRLLVPVLVTAALAGCGGSNAPVTVPATITTVYGHNVTFRNSTSVAWGYNGFGQLGVTPNVTANAVPVAVTGLPKMKGYSVGGVHSIAFTNQSTVFAWGNNQFNQLGAAVPALTYSATPVPVPNLSGITAVSAGGHHSLALKGDKSVWAWGYNAFGQLGDGTNVTGSVTTTSPPPVLKPPAQVLNALDGAPLAGIIQIAAGGLHSLALQEVASGSVLYAWGDNTHGQLGFSPTTATSFPSSNKAVIVPPFPTGSITFIAAGASHNLAITSDDKIWAWGNNVYGQLGPNANPGIDSAVPVEVPIQGLPSGVKPVAVAAGLSHSLVLMDNGSIYAWGLGYHGQLGNNILSFTVPVTTPQQVQSSVSGTFLVLAGPKSTWRIQALGNSSLAYDGTKVYAWGDNGFGQLGDGTTTNRGFAAVVSGF